MRDIFSFPLLFSDCNLETADRVFRHTSEAVVPLATPQTSPSVVNNEIYVWNVRRFFLNLFIFFLPLSLSLCRHRPPLSLPLSFFLFFLLTKSVSLQITLCMIPRCFRVSISKHTSTIYGSLIVPIRLTCLRSFGKLFINHPKLLHDSCQTRTGCEYIGILSVSMSGIF